MLYIRTDMNDVIATGHVMRCLAIADAAKTMGESTTFILADEQAEALIEARGHRCIVLHTQWNAMESELTTLMSVIEEREIKSILIDSYQVTERYLESLTRCVRTTYLDDLNAFHYPVNAIICYASYWDRFGYKERYPDTELYLGTGYVPLRQVFWKTEKKIIHERVGSLVLLSGGTDHYDVVSRILEGINRSHYRRVDVICGIYNTRYERLCERYEAEENIYIHKGVTDIERYMKSADVAISAGGTTLYELCACGTPTISYAFADNQLDNVRRFHEDGIIDYAGDVRSDDIVTQINRYLEEYQQNRDIICRKSERMQRLVDGKGAMRIACMLINKEEEE